MIDSQVLSFAAAAAVLTLTPGAGTMLVMRTALARGRRAGFLTSAGICSGVFFHAALSALGISVILSRSVAAFSAVRLLGACYLMLLGLQSLGRAVRARRDNPNPAPGDSSPGGVATHDPFLAGAFVNILNPVVAVFYLTSLPRFVGPGDWVFGKSTLLATVHVAQVAAWHTTLIVSLDRARSAGPRLGPAGRLELIAGFVLLAYGLWLAAGSAGPLLAV